MVPLEVQTHLPLRNVDTARTEYVAPVSRDQLAKSVAWYNNIVPTKCVVGACNRSYGSLGATVDTIDAGI